MGDMADWMLERCDCFDEDIESCFVKRKERISGPGPCPICGEKTRLLEGRFGKFYDCIDFPICKGSRDFIEP